MNTAGTSVLLELDVMRADKSVICNPTLVGSRFPVSPVLGFADPRGVAASRLCDSGRTLVPSYPRTLFASLRPSEFSVVSYFRTLVRL